MTDTELLLSMRQRIEMYSAKRIPLHQLVNDLQTSAESLISVSQSWRSQFQKEWFALEEVNAIRLDEEYSGDDDLELFVNETCGRLLQLIDTPPNQPPSRARG